LAIASCPILIERQLPGGDVVMTGQVFLDEFGNGFLGLGLLPAASEGF
jgi:hypothetical protein